MSNIVITISRQYGAAGREIAQKVAEKLGVNLYDRQLVHIAAAQLQIDQLDEAELLNYCRQHNIVVEAYSPLGGEGQSLVADPRIQSIADYLKVTPAQILLRWNIQRGVVVIPKSVHADRIKVNSQVFDFELSQDEMDAISSMNANMRRAFDSDRIDQRPDSTFPKIVEED